MKDETIYWTTKDGSKINVDEMSTGHLRKVLKMIIRQNPPQVKQEIGNIEDKFSQAEIDAITNKSQYQQEHEDNLWK